MSPQIIWRDDGPLMLPGQVVAGSEKCCCETPPPKLCLCPDLCVYKLAMTSPTNLTTEFTCDSVVGILDSYNGACLHKPSITGWTADPPLCTLGSGTNFFRAFKKKELTTATVTKDGRRFLGRIRHEGNLFKCFDSAVSFQGSTFAGAFARWSVELIFEAACGYVPQSFSIYYGGKSVSVNITPVAAFLAGSSVPAYSRTVVHSLAEPVLLASSCNGYDRRKFCLGSVPPSTLHDILYLDGEPSFSVPSVFEDLTLVYDDTVNNLSGWPNSVISSAASGLYSHCEDATASFTINSRPVCDFECCCKPDGTIVELQPGEECYGEGAAKPEETCDWYGVMLTITVDGVSGTASVDDWAAGEEPIFSGGGFTGSGAGALPNGKFIQTLGSTSCDCNLRSIYLDINYSGECFLSLRINECTNVAVVELDPSSTSCTNPPEIGCTVEWNPAP